MTDIPPPHESTIRCMLEAHRERCKAIDKPEGLCGIEAIMLEIVKELGGLSAYILGVWCGPGQQDPLTSNRPDFLCTGRIFTHLLELMNLRGVSYTDKVHGLVLSHIDNPYRYKEGHEAPIPIHFSAITRAITTFGWKDANQRDLRSAAVDIIVALWNIGRSLNFNPAAALVYIAGGIQERESRPVVPTDLISIEDYNRLVGNTEAP